MTIFESYNYTKKELSDAGIEDYSFETKQILRHITGMTSAEILANYWSALSPETEKKLIEIIEKRKNRYPLQYIFGEWDFYGRPFFVGEGVLIPRSDTEVLIDEALCILKENKTPKILDLCSGSGCIGITLAKELPDSSVTLVEKFDEALNFAKKNITLNSADNVRAEKGDVLEGDFVKSETFDLIASNPPYIPESEIPLTSPEVRFEPETALFVGEEPMKFYKAIIENYADSLKTGGAFCFEAGLGKADAVANLLLNAGFKNINKRKDLNGIERAVSAIKL